MVEGPHLNSNSAHEKFEIKESGAWTSSFLITCILPSSNHFLLRFPCVSDHTTYRHCLSLLHIENYIKSFDTLFGILPFDFIHICILQNKVKDASNIVISPWRFPKCIFIRIPRPCILLLIQNTCTILAFHSLTTSLHLFIPSSFLFYLSLITSPDI